MSADPPADGRQTCQTCPDEPARVYDEDE